MKVIWLQDALYDLQALPQYIAQDYATQTA
jgi:hypothetical protein